MNCDEAFECLTASGQNLSRSYLQHLETCERCRQMEQILSPALELITTPVIPWNTDAGGSRVVAPREATVKLAEAAAVRLRRRTGTTAWRWAAYVASAGVGAAAALLAMAVLPKSQSNDQMPRCAWTSPAEVRKTDAQSVTLSCVVCHLERGR